VPTYDGPGRAGDAVEADRDIAEQRRSRSDTASARPAQRPSVIELFEEHYRRERASGGLHLYFEPPYHPKIRNTGGARGRDTLATSDPGSIGAARAVLRHRQLRYAPGAGR
jgi:hypothetical protein